MGVEPLIVSCQGQIFDGKSRKLSSGRSNKVAPKGCVTVYVGEEQERFIVPIGHLHSPYFTELLKEASEVYGFDHKGPLRIPCRVDYFEQVMRLIERK